MADREEAGKAKQAEAAAGQEDEYVILGSGVLGWPSGERHTDRYGAVHLTVLDSVPGEPAPDRTIPVFREDLAARIARDLAGLRAGRAAESAERPVPGRVSRVVTYDGAPAGTEGILVATIIAPTRDRDWRFDPLGPPEPGEQVVLGTGTLFTETYGDHDGPDLIGVRPADGRDENWMDPGAMFRCKDYLVRLSLKVPETGAPERTRSASPSQQRTTGQDDPARTAAGDVLPGPASPASSPAPRKRTAGGGSRAEKTGSGRASRAGRPPAR